MLFTSRPSTEIIYVCITGITEKGVYPNRAKHSDMFSSLFHLFKKMLIAVH